jgi:hypothetical protein
MRLLFAMALVPLAIVAGCVDYAAQDRHPAQAGDWENVREARYRKLLAEGWQDFPASKVATAWRDVQFTYGAFKLYAAEGRGSYFYEPWSERVQ